MQSAVTAQKFGLTAILLDCADLGSALALHQNLQQNPPAGVEELIPAAQTVLVRFETAAQATYFAQHFAWDGGAHASAASKDPRTLEVIYEGQDLEDVAKMLNMSTEQVINAHTQQQWSVAFAGFAPGFFYLHAEDNVLEVPRRSSPRTAVPTGSVGLAGQFSGIYPRESPGGWQLIGRTNAPLWDLQQDPPALLEPGDLVQFKAVREHTRVASSATSAPKTAQRSIAQVITSGAQLLYQDAGRVQQTHWGVSPSGFADPVAAHEANYLVGNEPDATVLESLMGGFVLESHEDSVMALSGAQALAIITEGEELDRVVPAHTPFALLSGQTLRVGIADAGLRVYLAVRGGFDVELSAHSASYDTMSAVGPAPLTAGDPLHAGETTGKAVRVPTPAPELPKNDEVTEVRVILGPRENWFTAESLENFFTVNWKISPQSNRIGVRLVPDTENNSAVLQREITSELPSEGMISGAIQVPPNGEPVVFLADHPVTGGYPVIATVHPEDLRLLAQSQPGTTLRFTRFNNQEAIH